MGWFWADDVAIPQHGMRKPPHGQNMSGAPPPGCPMHTSTKVESQAVNTALAPSPSATSSCPYVPPEDGASSKPWTSRLNPLNMMPTFSQSRAENQKNALPTDRTISSIPKGTDPNEGNWEYPSPQQMYNAMVRKGHNGEADNAVVSMVDVHNFLNEGAWDEIVAWERQFGGGVVRGWKIALNGGRVEENDTTPMPSPRLLRFQGRPQELTPKAKFFMMLGKVYPSRFGGPVPFDRHDWYVLRQPANPTSSTSESQQSPPSEPNVVRYVIDYYDAPPEPTGEPVFYLDVRPAIDSPSALFERTLKWGGDTWYKATGSGVREEMKRQKLLTEQDEFA